MIGIKSLFNHKKFKDKIIAPEDLCHMIKPGMRIFISSGPATPANAVSYIANTAHENFQDLEIIQLTTPWDLGLFMSDNPTKFRFKTFSIGENVKGAMQDGLLDIIPTNIAEMPYLFLSGAVEIDLAIVQTSLPDNHGNLNLGAVNDINRIAIRQAKTVIAEINPFVPMPRGEMAVDIDHFDYVLPSDKPLLEFHTKPFDDILNKIGKYIASLIEDGSTVSLNIGRLFDAIAHHLGNKKNLRVWTHIVSDWIMGLIESGAIAEPEILRKDSPVVATSAIGTKKLYSFIDNNDYISLHPLFNVTYQKTIPSIQKLIGILNVNKIDITGDSVILSKRDLQITGFDSKMNFAIAATHSRDGKVIAGLRSCDREGNSNIVLNHQGMSIQHRCTLGTIRYVVTEYGIASIFGKSIRERVMSLLEIAHPDHRQKLFDEAQKAGLVYSDQIFSNDNALNYPYELETTQVFKDDLEVKFRPVKPSDEEMMRRFFYHFSDEAKYLRYFSAISTMPHKEMQRYVNIDYVETLACVGIVQERGIQRIVAEWRYSRYDAENTHEAVFSVDEEFQRRGIATYMLKTIFDIARKRGVERLTAYILPENSKMLSILENSEIPPRVMDNGDQYRYDFYL